MWNRYINHRCDFKFQFTAAWCVFNEGINDSSSCIQTNWWDKSTRSCCNFQWGFRCICRAWIQHYIPGLKHVYLFVLGLTSVAWFSGLVQWRFDMILITWNRHYSDKLMHRCTCYWHGLPEIMTWISDYIHGFIWGVITYPCPNFSCGSTKLGHWWVITFHSFTWVNLRD